MERLDHGDERHLRAEPLRELDARVHRLGREIRAVGRQKNVREHAVSSEDPFRFVPPPFPVRPADTSLDAVAIIGEAEIDPDHARGKIPHAGRAASVSPTRPRGAFVFQSRLVGIVAALIAGDPNSRVLGLVSNAWAGFGAAFGPLIVPSLTWPRVSDSGAVAGLVVGAATVILWLLLGWNASFLGGPGVYEIIPGFIAAWAAI